MALLDVYADSVGTAYDRQLFNPGPAPEIGFRTTSMIGSILKAFPRASFESAGSLGDILSAAGTADAAAGYSAGGMFALPTAKEQKEQEAARQRMLSGDVDLSAGIALRRKASEFSADPLTTHVADQVMNDLATFGVKAAFDLTAMGPAGALVLGADTANTVTQNLRTEGVDTATAAKVGAVQGGMAAAGAVLPVAGRTILQTLGLVAVGGPGSYVAQEALSRKILEQAGYNDQASLHNPFDPLGISLSIVIPGLFGGLHMRSQSRALQQVVEHIESGGQRFGKDGQLLTSPKGAQGEMQVMPGTARDPGFGVVPARDSSPEELARVGRDYLTAMQQRYPDDAAKALAAYNAGPGAVDAAIKAHGADWLAHVPEETQKYVAKARALLGEHVATQAAKDPDTVDAARVVALNDTVQRSLPEAHDAHAQMLRAADIVGEEGGRAAESTIPDVHVVGPDGMPVDVVPGTRFTLDEHARLTALDAERRIATNAKTQKAAQRLSEIETELAALQKTADRRSVQSKPQSEAPARPADNALPEPHEVKVEGDEPAKPGTEMSAAPREPGAQPAPHEVRLVAELMARHGEVERLQAEVGTLEARMLEARPNQKPFVQQAAADSAELPLGRREQIDFEQALQDLQAAAKAARALRWNATRRARAEAKADIRYAKLKTEAAQKRLEIARAQALPPGASAEQLMHQIGNENPNLMVLLPGSEEKLTMHEALARIAAEQKEDEGWGELVRAAAACALSA